MKKLLTFFALMFVAFTATQMHAESMSVHFPDITLQPGESAEMVVSYDTDYQNLSAFQIEFGLPSGIHLADAKLADGYSCPENYFGFNPDRDGTAVIMNTLYYTNTTLPSGHQDFLVLTFLADADAVERTYDISTTLIEFSHWGWDNADKYDSQTFHITVGSVAPVTNLCPDNHHPHMIDLGLPSGTKWACCNVGADKPEGLGGHYAWGETEERDDYSYFEGARWDDTDIQASNYDVAYVKWGSQWHMPNNFYELINNCSQKSVTINGVNGMLLTGLNGNSIFLPIAGRYEEDGSFNPNYSIYWESDGVESMPGVAYCAWLYEGNISCGDWWKYTGGSVRPVSVNSSTSNGQIVMERKYMVHHGGSYNYPGLTFKIDNDPNRTLTLGYFNTRYWRGAYGNSINGIHIIMNEAKNDNPDEYYKEWYIAPLILDEWVKEKLIINVDGYVKYYMNDQLMGEEFFDGLNLKDAKKVSVEISPYGWWTGHYHYMDDFHLSTPATSISDDFNDGVINTDIWRTPINPDGVREEDGIIKMEQLRTDQDFNLYIDDIPLGAANPEYAMPGDVNADGDVNITDVALTVNHILGTSSGPFKVASADVNDDLDVNITDVVAMVNYILGASSGLELGWYMVARQADGNEQAMPMREVGNLVAAGDAYDFTILDTNGNTLLENVLRAEVRLSSEVDASTLRPSQASRHLPADGEALQPAWKSRTMDQDSHPFIVAEKNGSNQFVHGVTFQYGENGLSWTADGQTGAVRDLSFIARTSTTLSTADGEDVIQMLEELSSTDQADAEAIASAIGMNENVEEVYSADGDNVVVKMEDDDNYIAFPMYSLKSVFTEDEDMEIYEGTDQPANMPKAPVWGENVNGKVAVFNFFESDGHEDPQKKSFALFICNLFKRNQYQVHYFGKGEYNNGVADFTMSKLDEVISHSSEYAAIIIMSHGYETESGESYFATCEPYRNGVSYPDKQVMDIHGSKYVAHSSKMKLDSNCLLYLGPCFGVPKKGYGEPGTTYIGWKGKNAVSQIHAAVFFHKLFSNDRYTGVDDVWSCTFEKDPFNIDARPVKSNEVKYWQYVRNSDLQSEYADDVRVVFYRDGNGGKDRFIKKTGNIDNLVIKGYVSGNVAKYAKTNVLFVNVEPLIWFTNDNHGAYGYPYPKKQHVLLQKEGAQYTFEINLAFKPGTSEGIYKLEIRDMDSNGGKMLKQTSSTNSRTNLPTYLIYSSKLDDNYALPTATDEDVYMPSVLGSDGQPVTEITIPAGTSQTYQLDAYPGHTFDTPCLDTLSVIAKVSLSGKTLTVTGVGEGSTVFGVFDRQNHLMAVVNVTVTAGGASYLTCPDDHHPHMIDLGLPSGTKWACCNVDDDSSKQSPTNYGSYYAWGETKEHDDLVYTWSTYTHRDGSSGTCHDLGSDIAGTQFDVAHVRWGGSWVMPTHDQQMELLDNCTYEWTTVNGVNGGRFTSKTNGGSIFLPAAGGRWESSLYDAGSGGYYWSSTQRPSGSYYAFDLYFYSGDVDWGNGRRYSGFTVRPVSR